MKVEAGKTYIGVVEDNNDPKKLGRVKIRVLDVFDNTPLEDIPFSTPWKDLSGDEFKIPDVGKVVTVVFDNGNLNDPEFIYSDHFNVNLEKKLQSIKNEDYLSMKALIFDHKTQIYVNDGEGLKLDHKFNVINIKEDSININIKDNFGKVNIGTENSTQRSILGDSFLNWFDDFVSIMMGDKGGPFLGNLMAPVQATPALLENLKKYKSLKDPKFLSKNVYIVDNEDVAKLDRISDGQKGDNWKSTVNENKLTKNEQITFRSSSGPSNSTFEQLDDKNSEILKPLQHPDVDIIIELFKEKGYTLYDGLNQLNILAIRNQCLFKGDRYTDQFVDKLYLMFKNNEDNWELKKYVFSTVPGLEFTITDSWLSEKNLKNKEPWINLSGKNISMKEYANIAGNIIGDEFFKNGIPILVPSQYIDIYYMSEHKGVKIMKTISGSHQLVWRDNDVKNFSTFNPNNLTNPELIKPDDNNSLKIQRGYPGGKVVGSWSEGSQVFSSSDNLNDFFEHCEKHKEKYGNKFTYTLATKTDWDISTKNLELNKKSIL